MGLEYVGFSMQPKDPFCDYSDASMYPRDVPLGRFYGGREGS